MNILYMDLEPLLSLQITLMCSGLYGRGTKSLMSICFKTGQEAMIAVFNP